MSRSSSIKASLFSGCQPAADVTTAELATIKSQLATAQAKIVSLETTGATLANNVENMHQVAITMDGKLSNLENGISDEIGTVRASVTALGVRVATLESKAV